MKTGCFWGFYLHCGQLRLIQREFNSMQWMGLPRWPVEAETVNVQRVRATAGGNDGSVVNKSILQSVLVSPWKWRPAAICSAAPLRSSKVGRVSNVWISISGRYWSSGQSTPRRNVALHSAHLNPAAALRCFLQDWGRTLPNVTSSATGNSSCRVTSEHQISLQVVRNTSSGRLCGWRAAEGSVVWSGGRLLWRGEAAATAADPAAGL